MAGKKERQRKLAREHYARQQARRIQRTQRWRRIGIIVAACLAVIALGAGGYVALSGGGNKTAAARVGVGDAVGVGLAVGEAVGFGVAVAAAVLLPPPDKAT